MSSPTMYELLIDLIEVSGPTDIRAFMEYLMVTHNNNLTNIKIKSGTINEEQNLACYSTDKGYFVIHLVSGTDMVINIFSSELMPANAILQLITNYFNPKTYACNVQKRMSEYLRSMGKPYDME